MMHLSIDDTMLVAYVDGELDAVTARLVEEQLAASAAARERVEMFRETARLLRGALSEPEMLEVSPALTAKVTRLAARHRPGPRLPRLAARAWIPLAMAAAIAGYVVGATDVIKRLPFGGNPHNAQVAHILEEVADYHSVFASDGAHLVEVPASRQGDLEAWLGARLKFSFKVPDLRAHDLAFQGGRLLGIDRQPVAQLMYTGKDGQPVALCIALSEGDASSPLLRQDEEGMTLFGLGAGNHVFVVVGPSSNKSLRSIAETMPGLLKQS